MMATRAYQPAPLDMLLAAIPSLPRPILARLTARMIDRMDAMDPDPDLEDTEGNGPDVDERGNPLKGETPLPGQCEDDEEDEDRERESWPTQGAQWEIGTA